MDETKRMYLSEAGGACSDDQLRMSVKIGFPDVDDIVDDSYWGETCKVSVLQSAGHWWFSLVLKLVFRNRKPASAQHCHFAYQEDTV